MSATGGSLRPISSALTVARPQEGGRIGRLSRERWQNRDSIGSANIDDEILERATATAAGGIGLICELARQLGLAETINRWAPVMKLYAPYRDADHVLNIALNLLAGGTCLDHIECEFSANVWSPF